MEIKLLEYVYNYPLLSENDLNEIGKAHHKVTLKKNSSILKEGDTMDCYYILENGLACAYVHDFDNQKITTEFFVDRDIVIVPSSLFQQVPSQENLKTITDCTLWKIAYDDFQELFQTIDGLKEWGRLWFTYQLVMTKQRSLDMITKTATERYLNLMKERPKIIQSAPLHLIASYLGITDSSLSRIRREISS